MDAGVRWQLGRLPVQLPPAGSFAAADPAAFWSESAVGDPVPVRVSPARVRRDGVEVRVLTGPSHGPGEDRGSRHLVATAHLRPERPDLPFVLALHGLLAGSPRYEEWQCRRLTALGAHAARLDLPLHLRRTPAGARSGAGYITSDLRRTREVVRQSVEDCAAVLAWARREVSPRVAVLGTSLGGLIACLLAAHLELDAVVAVAPLCDPADSLLDHLPARSRRALGLVGDAGGSWGPDRAAARLAVRAALAPITPGAFSPPATPGKRIAIVRPLLDGIVGEAPMRALAEAWGTETWSYRHGHISVMHAHGLGVRLRRWLISSHPEVADASNQAMLAAGSRSDRAMIAAPY